jgi:hypothetical protein
VKVVVQSSPESSPMSMDQMSEEFVSKLHMPKNLDEYTYAVPIDSFHYVFSRTMVGQKENISAHFPKGSGDIILVTKYNGKHSIGKK